MPRQVALSLFKALKCECVLIFVIFVKTRSVKKAYHSSSIPNLMGLRQMCFADKTMTQFDEYITLQDLFLSHSLTHTCF